MLIQKSNPVGIDAAIRNLQTFLHSKLTVLWNVTDQYRCYGRCYRNKIDGGYIAENYEGEKEYKEVYWDDTLSAISFFGTGSKTTFDIKNKTDVHLVFFVDLSKIKPAIAHRADEEVRNQVQKLFGSGLFDFAIDSTELWLENVLREYPGSRREDRLKIVDMQPVHCFRINLKLLYDPKICNTLKI
ncbi:MAG TPA: hypothetical protein VMZ03_03855 [Chitinophagaceae bacterium]|nr:hypothetical protein [Chitinophagaceae bacterium]